jgi:hypothetical protein
LLGSQIDVSPLRVFLDQEGIELWRRELIVQNACGAVMRYAQLPDRGIAKDQIEDFLTAAEKLQKTFAPIGSDRYSQFVYSIAQTIPRGIYDGQPDVLRALEGLPVALDILCESARTTLATMKISGAPRLPKRAFVSALATAWSQWTGRKPTYSGEATWDEPRTVFERFVKIACCMLPSTSEFETGFSAMLQRGCQDVAQNPPN